jgi:phosphate transport system substrate-binding protein
MRALISIILIALLMGTMLPAGAFAADDTDLKGSVTLSGAWALYPIAVRWAEEFQKIYPDVRIEVSAGGAGKGMADSLGGLVDIGMVSRSIDDSEIKKGAYPIAVTKDAVVATINSQNPVLDDIISKGITRETFIGIFIMRASRPGER